MRQLADDCRPALISTSALAMAAHPLGSLKTAENVALVPEPAEGINETIEAVELEPAIAGDVAVAGHRVPLPAYDAATRYELGLTGVLRLNDPSAAVVSPASACVQGWNRMVSRDGSFPAASNQISVKYPLPTEPGET